MSNFFLKTKKEQYNCKQYKNLAEDEKQSQTEYRTFFYKIHIKVVAKNPFREKCFIKKDLMMFCQHRK